MSIEAVYSSKFAPETDVWKLRLNGKQFLHLEVDKNPPLFGITWFTDIPTDRGLEIIRTSYARLKGEYAEVRALEGVGRVLQDFDGGFMAGDVTFALRGHNAPSAKPHVDRTGRTIAVELQNFLDTESFRQPQEGEQNPLLWIRVDTEYWSYYFQGEAFRPVDLSESCAMDFQEDPQREFGLIGNYVEVEEILSVLKETSTRNLSDDQLTTVEQKLKEPLTEFPAFKPREPETYSQ